jgi:hypothetical protein
MAITSDGTQSFGIQDSPVTIDTVVYICESMSFSRGSSRADLNDSNGEPVGSTIVPGRVEGSGSLQLAAGATALPPVGAEMELTGGRNAGTYLLTEVGDAQSQGDYAKVSISFYKKIN